MSVQRFVTLWCDADDCDGYVDTPERTARDGRKFANTHQLWGYREGKDLCPEHTGLAAHRTPHA